MPPRVSTPNLLDLLRHLGEFTRNYLVPGLEATLAVSKNAQVEFRTSGKGGRDGYKPLVVSVSQREPTPEELLEWAFIDLDGSHWGGDDGWACSDFHLEVNGKDPLDLLIPDITDDDMEYIYKYLETDPENKESLISTVNEIRVRHGLREVVPCAS